MEKKFDNKPVTKSAGFAGWLDDFIKGLAPKNKNIMADNNEVEDEKVTVAEINVQDLQKVIWNDETFFVNFNPDGANVLNEFGNTVTAVAGAKTIEEVDEALNSQQVVAEEAVEEGLEPVEAEVESTEGNDFEEALNEVVAEIGGDVQDEVTTEQPQENDPVLEAIIAGFGELESRMARFEEKVALVEQMYARSPELQNVDSQTQDEEVKHFTDSADQSAAEVAKEHSVDISTPAGRVELSQQPDEVAQSVQEVSVQETPAQEAPAQETEDVQDTDEAQDAPVQDTQEVQQVQVQETEEVQEPVQDKVQDDSKEESEDSEEEPKVEKLSGVAEKIFQSGVCPVTGEELVKSSKVTGNFLGIYSPKGNTEYAVNLENGEIFRYIG